MTGPTGQIEIYSLSDPVTGEVRYVGKANCAKARLKSHLRNAARRDTPVYRWIRKLHACGMKPELAIIEICHSSEWQSAEIRAIAAARSSGIRLLNVALGGDEPHCPVDVRRENGRKVAQMRQSDPRSRRVWELKRAIGSALKEGMIPEPVKAKLRLAAQRDPGNFGEYAAL